MGKRREAGGRGGGDFCEMLRGFFLQKRKLVLEQPFQLFKIVIFRNLWSSA